MGEKRIKGENVRTQVFNPKSWKHNAEDNKKISAVYECSSAVFETGAIWNHELITVKDCKAQILLETVKTCAKHTINNHNIFTKDLYSGVELVT